MPARQTSRTLTSITNKTTTMNKPSKIRTLDLQARQKAPLTTPSDLKARAVRDLSGALNALVADVFALYLKTKNFHWHMSGPNFRDYHLLLDEQADQLFAMTDPLAERMRKLGEPALKSIGQIARLGGIPDNDAEYVEPADMIAELCDDNRTLCVRLREVHEICDRHRDVATASLLEVWIDETERRIWYLYETSRPALTGGH